MEFSKSHGRSHESQEERKMREGFIVDDLVSLVARQQFLGFDNPITGRPEPVGTLLHTSETMIVRPGMLTSRQEQAIDVERHIVEEFDRIHGFNS